MKLAQLSYGIATFVPGAIRFLKVGTGGTDTARYCYSVWLRHLVMAHSNGLDVHPRVVAELGPGDSIGIGLAALLSGVEQYFSFDVIEYANPNRNLRIFDELVMLYENRENIPGEDEYPKLKPYLNTYDFPRQILSEKLLSKVLTEERIIRIRDSLMNSKDRNSLIQYRVPWFRAGNIEKESLDDQRQPFFPSSDTHFSRFI